MASIIQDEFSIGLQDSLLFSQLSGDFNPLHIEPLVARRLRFGTTVVHGIHVLLASLNALAARGMLDGQEPAAISTAFDGAVLTGRAVALQTNVEGNKIRLSAHSADRRVFNAVIELQPMYATQYSIADLAHEAAAPDEVDFARAPTIEGSLELRLSTKVLRTLFPALSSAQNIGWIADLLATTRIVGMRCPGLHSIYSGLRLQRAGSSGSPTLRFRVDGAERRIQLLRIHVAGMRMEGTIEAFFRPGPVRQRSMPEVANLVAPGDFAASRVLIVGGSRGLGEISAKILAAGGADVTITYARGREDAQAVCAEIQAAGRHCVTRHFDVSATLTAGDREWLRESKFTHVYFFASPLITKSIGAWDEPLFRQLTSVYVTAFAGLAEAATPARSERRTVGFLYPSSIFVTKPTLGFAEYAVAKAAGEALCSQLQLRHPARFATPRLPRMQTDQTSSVIDDGAANALPVMLDVIRHFHAT